MTKSKTVNTALHIASIKVETLKIKRNATIQSIEQLQVALMDLRLNKKTMDEKSYSKCTALIENEISRQNNERWSIEEELSILQEMYGLWTM